MARYSKQSYEEIAEILRESDLEDKEVKRIALELIDLFERDNKLFNADRFLRACLEIEEGEDCPRCNGDLDGVCITLVHKEE